MRKRNLMAGLLAGLLSTNAFADVYSDDLGKCLVAKTTEEDRAALVRWMFAAASAHPAVASIASVSKENLDKANHETGSMFVKLMTESCRSETKLAVKHEGDIAIELGFQVLGQVAGREMFASPEVAAAMGGLVNHPDVPKIAEMLQK